MSRECLQCGEKAKEQFDIIFCRKCGFSWRHEFNQFRMMYGFMFGGTHDEVPIGCLAVFNWEKV
jgi:hypothetical protein